MLNTSRLQILCRLTVALALVAAAGGTALAQTKVAAAYFSWNGSLTPSFGSGGLVTTDFPPAAHAWGRAMAIDSLGKIIVAGNDSDDHFVLACYDRFTGALDPGFGIGGRVVTSFGVNVPAQANAVAIAGNGDIIVVGSAFHLDEIRNKFAIARYSSKGELLQSVETNFPDAGSSDVAQAVAIDTVGRFVVAGYSLVGLDGRIALARYESNLTLDPTFNGDGDSDGLIVTNLRANSDLSTYDREQANGIAFLGGHIVIAGHSVFGYPSSNWYGGEFLVLRYRSNGSLYGGFDGDGIAIPFTSLGTTFDKTFRANAVAVDPNGKILAAGRASINSGGPYFALVRLNRNGTFDTTFSGDGKVLTSFGWSTAPADALAIALRGTSSIMLAGWSGTGASRSAMVTRYTSTGSLDTTFDGDGRAAADFNCGGAETATAVALLTGSGPFQTYPRIYVAGYASGDPCP